MGIEHVVSGELEYIAESLPEYLIVSEDEFPGLR